MRTANQIAVNRFDISNAKRIIDNQIALLENEYQQDAINECGVRIASWDTMIAQLQAAKEALNAIYHMELAAQDYVENNK